MWKSPMFVHLSVDKNWVFVKLERDVYLISSPERGGGQSY
jgi:hypothetical protein